jgi:cytochrome P450
MSILVSELNLPKVHPKIIKTDLTTYDQLEIAKKAADKNWLANTGIAYVVLDNEHSSALLKDKRWHNGLTIFSDANPHTSEKFKESRKKSIISLEGEDHSRIRRLVAPYFTPKIANEMRPLMVDSAKRLLKNVPKDKDFDIQKDVFDRYPMQVLSRIIGVPENDWQLFSKWANDAFKNFSTNYDEDYNDIISAQKQLTEYTENLISEKKQQKGNDLISKLIEARYEEDLLSDEEVKMLIQALTLAGVDTMRCQLGLAIAMLDDKPEIQQLIAKRDNVENIVEEIIRLDNVFKYLIRVASEDIEYNGVIFPKGTIVCPALGAANFDKKVFDNPDLFIIDRPNRRSHTLSFGGGIHYCLGAALARAQMEEMLHQIYATFPNIKVSRQIEYKDPTDVTWGLRSIWVTV